MGQVKKKLSNLSLKKSFIFIVFIMLIFVAGLSAVTVWWCTSVQQQTFQSRGIIIHEFEVIGKTGGVLKVRPEDYKYEKLTAVQSAVYTISNIGVILFPVIYITVGVICSASLFYKLKLKQPIFVLKQSAAKVAENDLDFSIDFDNNDEMGQLCSAFEKMRKELSRNNKAMWQMVNERKQFNASINHDLRTPITVVKGYTEYLQKNIPKGRISDDKLQETLGNIMKSVNRLEEYVDSARDIHKMEQMELRMEAIYLPKFMKEVKDSMLVLAVQLNKTLIFCGDIEEWEVNIDRQILFRILENIIANAIRYAKQRVNVACLMEGEYLCFDISDDGKGFSPEELKSACCPFYTGKEGSGHLGMGLAICKTLCIKHGGDLILANGKDGGAKVSFKISIKE